MKLHIGCGHNYLPGWTNLDIDKSVKCDRYEDATVLNTIENNSCDIIYACHILEHFSRHDYLNVLSTWFQKLKKGGRLRLSVPDFSQVVKVYNSTQNIDELVGLIVGGQKDEHDFHQIIFDEKKLSRELLEIGFDEVKKWDWRLSSHGSFDDYSQAYLPHMDKDKGKLMSLNLEAYK